jgi:PAS domain S-box-containing protein
MNTLSRILIVEDDAILATELQEMITRIGYQVSGLAATGKEAVKLALAQKPDIILMDIHLRGTMTGIQAVEQIHQHLDIPVVYLTAYADEALLQQAKIAGAYAFLVKPMRERELRSGLEIALYKHSTEQRLQHLNQILHSMRDINQLITHEHGEQRMIDQACQILLRTPGYRLVQICQPAGDRLKILSQAGDGQKFIARIEANITPEQGQKLPGTEAARTRRVVVCPDMLHDERYAPWRKEVGKVHFSSMVAIPIFQDEILYGVLSIYSDQVNIFVAEEIELLLELAGDIAFGLKAIAYESEHKQADYRIKESEEKYRLIVENIGEGFGFMNVEEQFLLANKSAELIFGVEPGGLVGKNLDQFLSKDQLSKVQQETIIRKQGIQSIYELEIIRPNGEKRTIHVTAVPKKHKNESFSGTYGIFRDITEIKRAEQEIKLKNEELSRAISEKDKFFSIIAHDLRSPFNVFLGFSRLLVEELPSLRPDEIQRIALNMKNSANKLYSLLENLLEWSQMQQGLLRFRPKSFNFMNKVVQILDSMRDTTNHKMIAIGIDFPEDLIVIADENMFASLIRNLLLNSIKFTPKNGSVILAAKPIPGNLVEVSISDTGIGMNKDLLDKLFMLGEDTCRKGTDGEPSSGLGLIICRDFVDQHGGKIWAESEEGKGSTFYFTIPRDAGPGKEIAEKTVVPQKSEKNPIKNLKILVVEDEENSDMFIRAVIRIFCKEIFTAKTGIEALEICRNNPGIDLVLMDIMIPEMNGYEATRQIRLFNKELIIIAQTAYAQEGAREMAIAAGCNDYISKPIYKDELLALIQKYFKK